MARRAKAEVVDVVRLSVPKDGEDMTSEAIPAAGRWTGDPLVYPAPSHGLLTVVRGIYPALNAAYEQTDRAAVETIRKALGDLTQVVEAILEQRTP